MWKSIGRILSGMAVIGFRNISGRYLPQKSARNGQLPNHGRALRRVELRRPSISFGPTAFPKSLLQRNATNELSSGLKTTDIRYHRRGVFKERSKENHKKARDAASRFALRPLYPAGARSVRHSAWNTWSRHHSASSMPVGNQRFPAFFICWMMPRKASVRPGRPMM